MANDKFSDSSFTRSRSSSSSSANQQQQHLASGQTTVSQQHESILCLAFLDPARLFAGGAAQSSSSSAAAAAAGVVSSSTSSSSQHHKSLSSIDTNNNSGGHLALWLGTSMGQVLLVSLTLPDNEDNRILQLQSIIAEPIPQASIKLVGQILALEAFVCEARLVEQAPAVAAPTATTTSTNHQSNLVQGSSVLSSQTASQQQLGASDCASEVSNQAAHSPLSSTTSSSSGAPTGGSASLSSTALSADSSRLGLFLLVASQKQARVFQVPLGAALPWTPTAAISSSGPHASQESTHENQMAEWPLAKLLVNKRNLIGECELSETSCACRAQLVRWRSPDECCLVSYLATGHLIVHPLPRLRSSQPLLEADFVPYTRPSIARSMCLSRNGHCLYQPSSGEVSKFTLSTSYKCLVNEMLGLAYVPREMPEQPRGNFFRALFQGSQASKQSDRDELFGECSSGKAARNVAKHLGSGSTCPSSTMDKLKSAAIGTMGHEMRVAREGLDERGEKLGELEDKTLNMLHQSESYAQGARELAQKFKGKKWYQF